MEINNEKSSQVQESCDPLIEKLSYQCKFEPISDHVGNPPIRPKADFSNLPLPDSIKVQSVQVQVREFGQEKASHPNMGADGSIQQSTMSSSNYYQAGSVHFEYHHRSRVKEHASVEVLKQCSESRCHRLRKSRFKSVAGFGHGDVDPPFGWYFLAWYPTNAEDCYPSLPACSSPALVPCIHFESSPLTWFIGFELRHPEESPPGGVDQLVPQQPSSDCLFDKDIQMATLNVQDNSKVKELVFDGGGVV